MGPAHGCTPRAQIDRRAAQRERTQRGTGETSAPATADRVTLQTVTAACKPPFKPPRRRCKPLRKRYCKPPCKPLANPTNPSYTQTPHTPQAILRRAPSALRPQTGCAMLRLVRSHRPPIQCTASTVRYCDGQHHQRTAAFSSSVPHVCLRGDCARGRRGAAARSTPRQHRAPGRRHQPDQRFRKPQVLPQEVAGSGRKCNIGAVLCSPDMHSAALGKRMGSRGLDNVACKRRNTLPANASAMTQRESYSAIAGLPLSWSGRSDDSPPTTARLYAHG
jgi:hypothetical protein